MGSNPCSDLYQKQAPYFVMTKSQEILYKTDHVNSKDREILLRITLDLTSLKIDSVSNYSLLYVDK